jgi:hypothetical protein
MLTERIAILLGIKLLMGFLLLLQLMSTNESYSTRSFVQNNLALERIKLMLWKIGRGILMTNYARKKCGMTADEIYPVWK